MRLMPRLACALLIALLTSWAAQSRPEDIDTRVAYWESRLANEVPPGSPKVRLEEWIASLGNGSELAPSSDLLVADPSQYVFSLETLKGDGVVCATWTITATATIEAGTVKHYEVTQQGVCL